MTTSSRRSRFWLLPILLLGAPRATPASAAEKDDAEVLTVVMVLNENEIDAANLAVQKDIVLPVMDFAKMMQKDHGANLERTRELSEDIGAGPAVSQEADRLRAKAAKEQAELASLEGERFSDAYIKGMVEGHEDTLKMIDQRLMALAEKADVLKHLQQTREQVAAHLDEAKKIRAALEGK